MTEVCEKNQSCPLSPRSLDGEEDGQALTDRQSNYSQVPRKKPLLHVVIETALSVNAIKQNTLRIMSKKTGHTLVNLDIMPGYNLLGWAENIGEFYQVHKNSTCTLY